MAYEIRGNDKKYYYRSERVDGRVQKTYLGRGLLAEVESMRLESKAMLRAQITAEKQLTLRAETLLKQQIQSTAELTLGLMISVGYTNERYRGWRRLPMIAPEPTDKDDMQEQSAPAPPFSELVNAARNGDRSVIPAMRRMLQANPELAKNNGDLACQTQIHWIDLIAGQDLYYRECLLMRMAEMKREFIAESNGTLAEKMHADQAISTWLQLYYHEEREAKNPAENIKLGEFRLKKIESAFNRNRHALNSLTTLKAVNFSQKMVEQMNQIAAQRTVEKQESFPTSPTGTPPINRVALAYGDSRNQ